MERIKFANGNVYDIVPGGLSATEEALKIVLLSGEKTLSDIDAETDNELNTVRVELLDAAGEALDIKKGFIYQSGCEKKKDYVIGREEYEDGTDEEGNPIMAYRDITGTVVIVTLKKSDMRRELSDLKETVDMLVVSNLGEV